MLSRDDVIVSKNLIIGKLFEIKLHLLLSALISGAPSLAGKDATCGFFR